MPSLLLSPYALAGLTLRNRIVVSPMCEYSSVDGFANDWHLVHLGSRAVGGAGIVLTEATAVTADGRISPHDLGIYQDAHVDMLSRIFAFVREHGAVVGVQLAHAGRKASNGRPWDGGRPLSTSDGGWEPIWAPSAQPFRDGWQVPRAMTRDDIAAVVRAFAAAASRVLAAGGQVIELHAAHGYLLHEFLSPVSNQRDDEYGGAFDNRARFLREVVDAVRRVWPERLPLFVRISATDWVDGGWTLDDSVSLARDLKNRGVDLIDCSTGGNVAHATIPVAPGYQVPGAERVRREAGIPTGAVGLITEPRQAEEILQQGRADLIVMARQLLRDPYWPLHAAQALGDAPPVPDQYLRAF
ncbi:MAG TPA: NADH:flavin oxidoreductase/NADH oxidase [Vicinamibacterales bacterium]|jgi:2,4-dienoyl-CoA reductase-like NADH-dependent reductase (Old Yellow Enzyme family)